MAWQFEFTQMLFGRSAPPWTSDPYTSRTPVKGEVRILDRGNGPQAEEWDGQRWVEAYWDRNSVYVRIIDTPNVPSEIYRMWE